MQKPPKAQQEIATDNECGNENRNSKGKLGRVRSGEEEKVRAAAIKGNR